MEDALKDPTLIILFGLVASWLTSLVKQERWSDGQKRLTAVAVAVIFGALATFINDDVTWETLWAHVGGVVAASQTLYWALLRRGWFGQFDDALTRVGG